MKYFIDTEFLEDFTRPVIGKRRHYIDLISIAIVAEDGREYYAVSNEFDIDHVWNNWLRDNVFMPIVHDLAKRDYDENGWYFADFGSVSNWLSFIKQSPSWERTWKPRAKALIKQYGQSNKQIAKEIVDFVNPPIGSSGVINWIEKHNPIADGSKAHGNAQPKFYGYYADYDWVLFCSLYGRMLDLPMGFPMYCRDLKQILDERYPEPKLSELKLNPFGKYPQQSNSHNALDDARWNKKLYDFLQTV